MSTAAERVHGDPIYPWFVGTLALPQAEAHVDGNHNWLGQVFTSSNPPVADMNGTNWISYGTVGAGEGQFASSRQRRES